MRIWLGLALLASVCLETGVSAEEQGAQEEAAVSQSAHAGKSADEIAKELNNPNNDLAKLSFKNQYRLYTGDLPGAGGEHNYTLLFQPVFPFTLGTEGDHKSVIFARPAFPFVFNQPVPGVKNGQVDYRHISGLGDIGMDLAFAQTYKSGLLWAGGVVNSFPTATDNEIGGRQWRIGPEALLGYIQPWGLLALFPSHLWNAAGWSDRHYSNTQLQVFAMFTPGGGWSVGSQPIMDYTWSASSGNHWTIPANLYVAKTLLVGKIPIQLALDLNYYVKQPDLFAQEWMIGFNVTPIIPNYIEGLFKRM